MGPEFQQIKLIYYHQKYGFLDPELNNPPGFDGPPKHRPYNYQEMAPEIKVDEIEETELVLSETIESPKNTTQEPGALSVLRRSARIKTRKTCKCMSPSVEKVIPVTRKGKKKKKTASEPYDFCKFYDVHVALDQGQAPLVAAGVPPTPNLDHRIEAIVRHQMEESASPSTQNVSHAGSSKLASN